MIEVSLNLIRQKVKNSDALGHETRNSDTCCWPFQRSFSIFPLINVYHLFLGVFCFFNRFKSMLFLCFDFVLFEWLSTLYVVNPACNLFLHSTTFNIIETGVFCLSCHFFGFGSSHHHNWLISSVAGVNKVPTLRPYKKASNLDL